MGGVCSNHRSLKVSLGDQTIEKPGGLSDYIQARKWIANEFPQLRSHPFLLQTADQTIIKNVQDYTSAMRLAPRVFKLKVIMDKQQILSTDPLAKVSQSVVKIKHVSGHVEATGILISETTVMTSGEILTDISALKDYSVLFLDSRSTEIKFNLQGIFKEYEIDGNSVVIAQLQRTRPLDVLLKNIKPIGLSSEISSLSGNILYFLKSNPILNKKSVAFELKKNTLSFGDVILKDGSYGAPIFDNEGKLIGIFSGILSAGVSSRKIVKLLRKEYKSGDNLLDDEIEYIFKNSNLDLPEDSVKEYLTDISDSITQAASYIDFKAKTLNLQNLGDTAQNVIVKCPASKGACTVVTPHGIFITGSGLNGESNKAWIYNQRFEEIKDSYDRHENHCSCYHDNCVYVISGEHTSSIEMYDMNSKK